MIVITGATGNVGRSLVEQLTAAGQRTRAVTRDPAQIVVPSGTEVVAGDLTKAESLEPAFVDADALFLLMTAGDPTNSVDLDAITTLASTAGIRHVVLVSSLLSQTHPESFPGRRGLHAEQIVQASALAWTILRPWELASNTLAWVPAIQAEGSVSAPTAGRPSPAIHPADIAAVAYHALTEGGHEGAIYPLTGPNELMPQDKVRAIAAAIGRELTFVVHDDPQALEQIARHAPDEIAAQLAIPGVCGLESPGVLPTVEQVTGAPARGFEQWARDNAHAFA